LNIHERLRDLATGIGELLMQKLYQWADKLNKFVKNL